MNSGAESRDWLSSGGCWVSPVNVPADARKPAGGRSLIVVAPTRGHLNTGVALANLMRRAGCRPLIASSPQVQRAADELGLGRDFVPVTSMRQDMDRRVAGRRSHLEQSLDRSQLTATVSELSSLIAAVRPSIVVGKDSFAARVAAARSACTYLSFFTDGVDSLLARRSRQTVPADVASAPHITSLLGELGMSGDQELTAADLMRSSVASIVRGFPEHDRHGDPGAATLRLLYAGFLMFDDVPARRAAWDRKLASLERPVVYVTFGTVCADTRRYHIAAGAVARAGGHLLLSTSPFTPDDLAMTDDGRAIFAYVPNSSALNIADVVVHHGGFGTTLAALAAGVPSVVVPDNDRTNQDRHGALVHEIGVGAMLRRDCLTEESLTQAIREMLQPAPRHRAAAVAEQLGLRSIRLQDDLVRAIAAADFDGA